MTTFDQELARHLKEIKSGKRKVGGSSNTQALKGKVAEKVVEVQVS